MSARAVVRGGAGAALLALVALAQDEPLPAPPPAPEVTFAPRQTFALQVVVGEPSVVDDVVAWRRMFPTVPGLEPPDVDLTRHVVLVVPAKLPEGRQLQWHRAALHEGEWRVELRNEPAPADAVPPPAKDRPVLGAMFVVPRVAEPVRVHVPIAEGPPPPLLTVPDAAAGAVPKVLALRELDLSPAKLAALRCERAATPAEWRKLRESLGDAGKSLPDDYADFAHQCVVLLAPPSARTFPRVALAVASEEDVDVVTITQAFPSGRLLPERTPAFLLTLPRRSHQLAIVLGTNLGPAPSRAKTVATFEPLR
jgi:hypothetical protein